MCHKVKKQLRFYYIHEEDVRFAVKAIGNDTTLLSPLCVVCPACRVLEIPGVQHMLLTVTLSTSQGFQELISSKVKAFRHRGNCSYSPTVKPLHMPSEEIDFLGNYFNKTSAITNSGDPDPIDMRTLLKKAQQPKSLDELAKNLKGKNVVVTFCRPQWCASSVECLPKLSVLTEEMPSVNFVIVDCDKILGAIEAYKITQFPTVMVYQSGGMKLTILSGDIASQIKNQLAPSQPTSPSKGRFW